MDVYCPKCGEPWELDSLHDEAQARYAPRYGDPNYDAESYSRVYEEVSQQFRTNGCSTFRGAACSPRSEVAAGRAALAAELYAVLGDDLDGASSMFGEAEYLGYF